MAKANVDPDELKRFARDLTRFNGELEGLMNALRSRLRGLEKTWQDQEQKRFTTEFDQTMKTLSRFLESSSRHATFLVGNARHIEDYLGQR